jgi:hypothetical protein
MALHRSLQELLVFADQITRKQCQNPVWIAEYLTKFDPADIRYDTFTPTSIGNFLLILGKGYITVDQRLQILQILQDYYAYAQRHKLIAHRNGMQSCMVELLRVVLE